jgi:Ca2+-binding RTX toxin-like protein
MVLRRVPGLQSFTRPVVRRFSQNLTPKIHLPNMKKLNRSSKKKMRSSLRVETLEQRQLLAGITGGGTEVLSNIVHSNGNVYDQVLMTGSSVSVTADAGQITRVSFLDLSGDIVQVEFSGAGSLNVSLDSDSFKGAAEATNYNQPGVKYVTGLASFTITGSDASTNFGVFTVGSATAHRGLDNPIFAGGKLGGNNLADVQRLTIVANPANANGSALGGIRMGNAEFGGSSGVVGISAANVAVQDVVVIGDINATGSAIPTLAFGSNSQFGVVTVAGGDLVNSSKISNSGYAYNVALNAGTTSGGATLAAKDTLGQLSFTNSTPASVANAASKSMDLTANIDSGASYTGGSANDSFYATATTLTAGDSLVGGTGTDRLNLTIVGAATLGQNVATSGVEQISIINQHNAVNTLNADLMVGVSDIYYSGTAGVTVANVPSLPNAHLTSIVGTVTVGTTATAKAGTADSVTVALNSAGVSAAGAVVYDGVETINVVSGGNGSGAAATPFAISGDSLQTVAISGAAQLFANVTLSGATGTKLGTISASALTGSADLTTAVPASGKLSVTGSPQNDTVSVTGAYSADVSVAGGAGVDTLKLGTAIGYTAATTTAAAVSNGTGVSGFEILTLTAGLTQDMRALAGNTIATVNIANTGTNVLSSAPTTIATLNVSEATATGVTVTLPTTSAGAATTTSNLLTVNLGDTTPGSVNGTTVTTLGLADHQNISLNSIGAANTVTTLTGTALSGLTVTGDQNLTVSSVASATGLSKIDAGAFTGSTLSVTASASTTAMTVTGGTATLTVTTGSGADTITSGAGSDTITAGTGNNSVVAGAGNDTVSFGATGSNYVDLGGGNDTINVGSNSGNNTILGGGGNDSITITGAGNNTVTLGAGTSTVTLSGAGNNTVNAGDATGISTITTGAGNDSITGGSANDVINSGGGNDTINAGPGNDSITIASLSSGDSIDGGTGTDSLTISSVVFTALPQSVTPSNISNVETIVLSSFGNGANATLNLANVSTVSTLRIDALDTSAAVTNNFNGLPSTVTTISLQEALAAPSAAETNTITYAAAPSALQLNVNRYMAAVTDITGLSAPLTINGVLTTANDGTARTFESGAESSVGTMITDASRLTVQVNALTAVQSVAGNELTVGAVTANFISSLNVSSNTYADVSFGGLGTNISPNLSSVTLSAGANSTLLSDDIVNNTTDLATTVTLNVSDLGTLIVDTGVNGTTGFISLRNAAVAVSSTLGAQSAIDVDYILADSITSAGFTVGAASTVTLPTLAVDNATKGIGNTTINVGSGSAATIAFSASAANGGVAHAATPATIGSITVTGDGTANVTVPATAAPAGSATTTYGAVSASGMTNTLGKLNFVGTAASSPLNVTGGAGADTLIGGEGADTITGGRGRDSISGGDGTDGADVFVATIGDSNTTYGVDLFTTAFDINDAIRVTVTSTDTSWVFADNAQTTAAIGGKDADTATANNFITITQGASLPAAANTPTAGTTTDYQFEFADNVAATAAIDRIAVNLTGTALADTLTTGPLADTISGGDGADVITGAGGADSITGGNGRDQFIVSAGSTLLAIGGTGNSGTITGFDTITDFELGSASANAESFDMSGVTEAVVANTTGTDGNNSTLTIGGAVVASHAISNGIITFDDAGTFATALSLATGADLAAVVQYLQANDLGDAGATVAFVVGSDTYVFIQGNDAGTDNLDVLVKLTGKTATSVSATNGNTAGLIKIGGG